MAPNCPVNLRCRVRVVNVARIPHAWQTPAKKIPRFPRIKYVLGGPPYAGDGKLVFNFVNSLNRSVK